MLARLVRAGEIRVRIDAEAMLANADVVARARTGHATVKTTIVV
jgi:hypothetical protein